MSVTDELEFFDCNCMVGRTGNIRIENPHKAKDLLSEMDYFGIKESLAYHAMSRDYAPTVGNQLLLDEIRGLNRFYPIFVILPEHTGEFEKPSKLMDELKAKNVRAVKMYPVKQNFSMHDWNIGNMLGALEDYGIPLFIEEDQINWEMLDTVLKNHLKLKFVLVNVTYTADRNLYPLLRKHKNLYFETCWYCINTGIENVVEKFGAERLLFGTNMTTFTPGISLSYLIYSRIPMEKKKMVAGDNLRRLLCTIQK